MQLTLEQETEIKRLTAVSNSTKRSTVTALEEIIYKLFPVLDHGFIRVIDYMGDDSAIVQAARVSYGRGTKKVHQDKGLINYLMRNRHTTPFEMCEIKFHVKMPIFVARQWIRHRTATVNECSARYSILDREFYIPAQENLAAQSSDNSQGRGVSLSENEANDVLNILRTDAEHCYNNYEKMHNEDEYGNRIDENRTGVARELARMNLTLNTYTQWYWKIDLHNLMHFLSLRLHPHAQLEIRLYAEQILEMMKRWTPMTYEAFMQYRMGGVHLSSAGLEAVKRMLNGEKVSHSDVEMTKREWNELMKVLDKPEE